MALRIGLTGGIGSGKSRAADHFRQLGVPVVDADCLTRELTRPGAPTLEAIRSRFGENILDEQGRLDRSRLRRRIFSDAAARRDLEALLHPAVRARIAAWQAALTAPYGIAVVPLLFEAGFEPLFDRILVIQAPAAERVRRVMARDRVTEAEVRCILSSQLTDKERRARADDLLTNDGSEAQLLAAVERLHRFYLQLAGGHLPEPGH